jgi:hypothetical protein
MALLLAAMAAATVVESEYDTLTAQFYVYQQFWFRFLLVLLGVNILCVALDRWPWRKPHLPFLLAHAGILILLYGSWLTLQFGIDGLMQIGEGESSRDIELPKSRVVVAEGADAWSLQLPWIPPSVTFQPRRVESLPFRIVKWITHAEPNVYFRKSSNPDATPALRVRLASEDGQGPPIMRQGQMFWLWGGDPSTKTIAAGGARLVHPLPGPGLPGRVPGT